MTSKPSGDMHGPQRVHEPRVFGRRVPTLFAWMLSTVVHAIGLCVAILLATDFSVVPRVAPFCWNVKLVTASLPSPISSDTPSPALASMTGEMPITQDVFVQALPPVMRTTSESSRAAIEQVVPATDGPMLGNTRLDNPIEASSQGKESTNAFPQSADDFLQEPHPEDPMPAAMMSPITSPCGHGRGRHGRCQFLSGRLGLGRETLIFRP